MIRMLQHTSAATRNSCRVCAPLGSSIAFLGIKGCMPLIHGGQGCSTYIRRYLIGHFREPVDIASTNFSEASAVFGGSRNLFEGIHNLQLQYNPAMIGISTSCLSETMGEDVKGMIKEWKNSQAISADMPELVHVATPSYKGSQRDGFYDAVKAILQHLVAPVRKTGRDPRCINLLPGFVSTEDIRHLREVVESFDLQAVVLPDYSQSLDDGQWKSWQSLPNGGTAISAIRECGRSAHTIEFELGSKGSHSTSGAWIEEACGVANHNLPMPIGVEACDQFFDLLSGISGKEIPEQWKGERSRLLDAYVDAHKYAFGLKVALIGDEELVTALARFCIETGMHPVLCATGGNPDRLKQALATIPCAEEIHVLGIADYEDVTQFCRELNPAMLIGNSKAYVVSRELDIPLIRVGFPIQDRIGGQRLLHVGYRGTQRLFDEILNTWLNHEQSHSPIGYKTY